MRKRDRKALGGYIRDIADKMELRDWEFKLLDEPTEDFNDASINPIYGRKLADIRVSREFRDFAPQRQRHDVVHELVHCHIESMTNMVYNDLEAYIGKPADRLFWEGYKRQMEYGVDALAAALAKHLPLIEWPEPS